ncbi:hypothetical protein IQ07DRAFT_596836 [Pyrenochaeta sp. DS3sAY3a]|nr:hypothetical protein IQ07DRAFT_596836 [Pyrenochaeta sp. DS3sAY3a]
MPASLDDSDSEEESGSSLRTTLWEHSTESAFTTPPKRFIPRDAIESIITLNNVQTTLGITQENDPLVQFVMQHAKRSFAIAVYARINVKNAMKWLMKINIGDSDLPFNYTKKKSPWRGDFYDNQWTFLARPFKSTELNHDFEANEILPFQEFVLVSQDGSFGDVYRAVIHDGHIEPAGTVNEEFGTSSTPVSQFPNGKVFAVKKIKPQQDQEQVTMKWENEVKALRAMNDLKQVHIVRFVTAFRRLWNDTEEHYVIFEWASGGNLRKMWKEKPSPKLTGTMIKHVIKQILGLATALTAAHNPELPDSKQASYRHGDLKPENILVFNDGGPFGTLKIGDWGEARYHERVTAIRPSRTITKFGTRRYEAPEVEIGVRITHLGQSMKRRSRLGDVWALGCITLEFIVWLLYGRKGLDQFNHEVYGETFYQIEIKNGKRVAQVHKSVVGWIARMAEDPICDFGNSALGELLEFVQSSLLVVNLPHRLGSIAYRDDGNDPELGPQLLHSTPQVNTLSLDQLSLSEEQMGSNIPALTLTRAETVVETEDEDIIIPQEPGGGGPSRCHASLFRDIMEGIFNSDEYYDFKEHKKPELPEGLAIVAEDDPSSIEKSFDEQARGDYASPELDENQWDLHVDNGAALKIFKALETENVLKLVPVNKPSALCSKCCEIRNRIRDPGFSKNIDVRLVQSSSRQCDLCRLLWKTIQRRGCQTRAIVRIERDRAFLKMNESQYPVLSLVREPVIGGTTPYPRDCQVGLVNLPEAGGIVHLEIIRSWLKDCDSSHECKPAGPGESIHAPKTRIPTRLIDVGQENDTTVRLRETGVRDIGDWVALSHRWGHRYFSTTQDNVKQHISDGLNVSELPATFRDAIVVTRALQKRYLWIDSICIIQGKGSDFQTESRRMADVYSGAYCVLAASCAADHYDGFLQSRTQRDHVTIAHEGKDQSLDCLCENLDNFKRDVLDGALNSRGWVLQEHALARRTIFFTDKQTYFECGYGVRCETSTKLTNNSAPCLLRINFPKDRSYSHVPSWSWMAYSGVIEYLRPDFNNYLWEDIQSPWSQKANNTGADKLIATAWDYDTESAGYRESELTLDASRASPPKTGICIVLGKAKGSVTPECRHWVLIIRRMKQSEHGADATYERIGAGYMPEKCLVQRNRGMVQIR